MRNILRRLGIWLHWRREQRELAEEMAAHRAMAGERAMGNEWAAREDARGVWLWPWVEALGHGLRLGARRLRRAPGFAAAAILTLALGIGASTAIFSVAESVLLHPLPYRGAGRMVAFNLDSPGSTGEQAFDVAQYVFLRDHLWGLSAIGIYSGGVTTDLQADGRTVWAPVAAASDGFFPSFGVAPQLGRDFTRADTATGAANVVILSDGLWRRAFGADPNVIGRTLEIHHSIATIVGVLPQSFRFLEQPVELYVAYPVQADLHDDGLNESIAGRLAPGFTLRQLQAEMVATAPQLRVAHLLPAWSPGVSAYGYQTLQTQAAAAPIWMLLGGACLLLLIALANVAGLMLARVLARQPEIAMRRALGAGRARLMIQMLAEGAVVAAAGATAGIGLAAGLIRTLASQLPSELPLAVPVRLDARVAGFGVLTAVVACLAFGTAAAAALPERRLTVGRFARRGWMRDALVIGEVALTLVLLAGAALLLQSLRRIGEQPLGFDPAGRTVFATELPAPSAQASAGQAWNFDQAMLRHLDALPGVQAATVNMLPLAGQNNIPGESARDPQVAASLELRQVSPGYLGVMAMPVLQGRGLRDGDTATGGAVAVVSESLAAKWFGGRALGQQIRMGAYRGKVYAPELAAKPLTVVGVVGDVKVQDVRRSARMTVYVPAAQWTTGETWWVARGAVNEAEIRAAASAANPGARVSNVEPYSALIAFTLTQPRVEAQLASAFAVLAIVLTAVGLFALLATMVGERTRELGIRMALGAQAARVACSVAARALALTAIGVVIGLAAMPLLAAVMASQLYGVTPTDLKTLAAAATALLAVALVASWLPARRATHVNVAQALRAD